MPECSLHCSEGFSFEAPTRSFVIGRGWLSRGDGATTVLWWRALNLFYYSLIFVLSSWAWQETECSTNSPRANAGDTVCPTGAKEMIFLTTMTSKYLLWIWLFLGVVISIVHKDVTPNEPASNLVKAFWFIRNVELSVGLGIVLLYWGLIGLSLDGKYYGILVWSSISHHGLNWLTMIGDVFISSAPVRAWHVYHPVLYGCFYTLFSLIYGVSGGTNSSGNEWIYKNTIDWKHKPGVSAVYCVVCVLLLVPACWWVMFKLWQWVDKKWPSSLHSHRSLELDTVQVDQPEQ